MRHALRWTIMSVAVASSFGAAGAQNTPTPNAEDAEKNAFQTPTTGKDAPTSRAAARPNRGIPIRPLRVE
jgi:hypothetical protein